jgi:hypothetical protein
MNVDPAGKAGFHELLNFWHADRNEPAVPTCPIRKMISSPAPPQEARAMRGASPAAAAKNLRPNAVVRLTE